MHQLVCQEVEGGGGGGPGPAAVNPPVIRERWRNTVRERENVHATVRGAFFMTLYGHEPRGGREWLLTRCRLDM